MSSEDLELSSEDLKLIRTTVLTITDAEKINLCFYKPEAIAMDFVNSTCIVYGGDKSNCEFHWSKLYHVLMEKTLVFLMEVKDLYFAVQINVYILFLRKMNV
jgi:hypothetical protein